MNIQTQNPYLIPDMEKRLIIRKIPYTLHFTGSTEKIKWKGGSITHSGISLEKSHLRFIQQVRKHVKQTGIKEKPLQETQYIGRGAIFRHVNYNKCVEIDINSAYWKQAFLSNYIDDDLYQLGNDKNQVPKQVRLIALGSLAKQETIYYWEPGMKEPKSKGDPIGNKVTRSYFMDICFNVDHCIREAIKKIPEDQYLFYWFDAIFLRSETDRDKWNVKQVLTRIKSMGFDCKVKQLERIENNNGRVIVYDDNGKRPFWSNGEQKEGFRMDVIRRSLESQGIDSKNVLFQS